MGFTSYPDRRIDESQIDECLQLSIKDGANMWNTSDFYGRPDPLMNLDMLKTYFAKHPEDKNKVYISVKGGLVRETMMPDASPESIRKSIADARERLGIDRPLDMFCLARVGSMPIEESLKAMKEAQDQGLVIDLCVSEVSEETLRKAHSVCPVAAVEVEYSMFSREVEFNGVFKACKELGITVVAYSPLGKGLLTNTMTPDSLAASDHRRMFDRFQSDNFNKNKVLVDKVAEIAKRKNATPGQIALSWIRTLSDTGSYPVIIPIPGSTNPKRVRENNMHVDLSPKDMEEIASLLAGFKTSGHRYNEAFDKLYK